MAVIELARLSVKLFPNGVIQVNQQVHIAGRVAGSKSADTPPLSRARSCCTQILPHQPLARFLEGGVLVPHQRLLHPAVHFFSPLREKLDGRAARQKRPDLCQARCL